MRPQIHAATITTRSAAIPSAHHLMSSQNALAMLRPVQYCARKDSHCQSRVTSSISLPTSVPCPRVRLAQLDRRPASPSHAEVERLDRDRESHREVYVALGNVMVEAVGDEHHPDDEEERERQHLYRRMRRDEAPDRSH